MFDSLSSPSSAMGQCAKDKCFSDTLLDKPWTGRKEDGLNMNTGKILVHKRPSVSRYLRECVKVLRSQRQPMQVECFKAV